MLLALSRADALRARLAAPTSVGHGTVTSRRQPRERDSTPVHHGGPADDPDYQNLWQALGHDPTGMDQLVERTRLTAAQLSSMLLLMELEGRVSSKHGRYYRNR